MASAAAILEVLRRADMRVAIRGIARVNAQLGRGSSRSRSADSPNLENRSPDMTYFEDEIVLRVDFNNVASGDRIKGSLRHASSDRLPEIGETVYLHDDEGNACYARVDEVRGQIVILEPEWPAWRGSAP